LFRTRLLAIGIVIVIASAVATLASDGPQFTHPSVSIPDTISSALPNHKPVWVAADVAFDAHGALRKELFHEAATSALESYLSAERSAEKAARNTGDCAQTINGSGPELAVSIDTADDLARNSMAVVRGEIVGARQGFYIGLPGTLFAVRVADRLKNVGGVSNGDTLYVFVDSARIETASGLICAKPFAPAASVPTLGDQVVLFAVFDAPDASHSIVPVDLTRTIVVQHDGRLGLPRAFRTAPVRSIDDVVSTVRKNPRLQELPTRWEAQ